MMLEETIGAIDGSSPGVACRWRENGLTDGAGTRKIVEYFF